MPPRLLPQPSPCRHSDAENGRSAGVRSLKTSVRPRSAIPLQQIYRRNTFSDGVGMLWGPGPVANSPIAGLAVSVRLSERDGWVLGLGTNGSSICWWSMLTGLNYKNATAKGGSTTTVYMVVRVCSPGKTENLA